MTVIRDQRDSKFTVISKVPYKLEWWEFLVNGLDQYQQIELLAKRRNLLSQFCKLIMHGVLPISDASLVLRYYVKVCLIPDILKFYTFNSFF